MASINRVIVAGNLTRDPELRYIPSGMGVSELRLAINDNYKNKDGQLVERTVFVDVVVWGKQAETCRDYLSKGSPVLVEGRLQLDEWETQQGEKRSKLRVRADRVQFLGAPRKGEYGESAPAGGGKRSGGAPAPASREEAAPSADEPPAGDDDDLPF